jgi:hypothetical protein
MEEKKCEKISEDTEKVARKFWAKFAKYAEKFG